MDQEDCNLRKVRGDRAKKEPKKSSTNSGPLQRVKNEQSRITFPSEQKKSEASGHQMTQGGAAHSGIERTEFQEYRMFGSAGSKKVNRERASLKGGKKRMW